MWEKDAMRFALLGPVQVHGDEAPVEIRGSLRRTLLAALLLSRGSVVSADRLAELIWGERPPAGVTTSLYNQVMRLRQALGEDAERIRAVAPGYLIHVEPGELDLDEFAGLCARARRAAAAADWPAAAGLYSDALALWRGEMLADVPALHEQAAIHQYEEDRLVALQGRIEADLNLGRQDELVGELRTLIGYHPLREAFHGQLMLALYRSGRQADALGVYRDLRRALIRELGVEPAAAVQELHHRILRSEPELRAPAAAAQSASAAPVAAQGVPRPRSVPRQLPVDSRLFTGRTAELEELVELAERAGEGAEAGMVVISAINGMGGIGKTALAVRAGHRVGAHFPDGQLFIDLRGYDAKLAPLPPEEALEYLLRSLGVPSPAIPADMDERAALYRSRLAGNRTLILLDNAASTAQVQPLLPGAAGCLVLITSRNRMMGLDDAHFFALDTLSPDEAIALLGKIAGAEPIGPCDPAARELVALCGYVPLAVRIVAARLRHNPRLTVPGLVEELREESGRLSQLRDEDRDLISVFESSFRSLPAAEARLFRLLGLLPGPDFDAYAAANLTADGLAATERRLDSLLGQNLLIQHTPGRYWLHDLLRTYARSLGIEQAEEQASLDRVFDYYEHTAVSASRLMDRRHRPPSSDRIQHPDPIRELPDYAAAVAWLGAERGNLVALMEHDCGPARRISLTASLTSFIRAETSKRQQLVWNTAALEAAKAAGQPADRAEALLNLARVYRTGGGFDVAVELLRRAIDGYRELDDKLGEANVQCEIGRFSALLDDYAAAAEGQERALAIYRGLGDRLGEADALYELSRVSSQVGRFEAAEKLADEALALFHELGRPLGEAQVRIVLADLRRRAGDFEEAVDLLRRSAAIFREARTRQDESNVLWTIGQIRLAQGRYDEAAELLEQTLVLCQEAGIQHGIGGTLGVLGTVRLAQGRYPEAAELLREALTVFQAIGHRNGIASSHQHLARVYHRTGDDTQAAALLDSATALFEQAGDRVALAGTWNVRGELLLDTRGADAALEWYRKALEAAREVKDSALQAEALHGLAHCLAATDRPSALTAQREAVEIYRRLAVPELIPAEDFLRSLESPVRAVPDPTK
jgi:DNA-binding SARP family transcriptional activator